jgi:hypothetical protein
MQAFVESHVSKGAKRGAPGPEVDALFGDEIPKHPVTKSWGQMRGQTELALILVAGARDGTVGGLIFCTMPLGIPRCGGACAWGLVGVGGCGTAEAVPFHGAPWRQVSSFWFLVSGFRQSPRCRQCGVPRLAKAARRGAPVRWVVATFKPTSKATAADRSVRPTRVEQTAGNSRFLVALLLGMTSSEGVMRGTHGRGRPRHTIISGGTRLRGRVRNGLGFVCFEGRRRAIVGE